MLADEYGTASNIKSRVNRLSVLGAITSVQQRLKLYSKVQANGLVRVLSISSLKKTHRKTEGSGLVSGHFNVDIIFVS